MEHFSADLYAKNQAQINGQKLLNNLRKDGIF
jgi:hypothetical protein